MRVPEYTFVLDQTGQDPRNKVTKEIRTITAANRPKFNMIIPHAAPFYANSLVIKHVPSNTVLQQGIHYAFGFKFEKAMLNVRGVEGIYSAILLYDKGIVGDFEITYQTLGGRYTLNSVKITEILANELNNPRVVDWEQVIGIPVSFPPYDHNHDLEQDLLAAPELTKSIDDVAAAIREIGRQDESDHPGYEQVITELFRLDRKDKALQVELDKIKLQMAESLDIGITGLHIQIQNLNKDYIAADTALKTDLTRVINNHVSALNKAISDARSEASQNLESFRTTFTATVNSQLSSMNTQIGELDKKIGVQVSGLNTTLTNLINSKEKSLQKLITDGDAHINTLVTNLTTTVKNNDDSVRNAFAAADVVLNDRITSVQSTINTSIATTNQNVAKNTEAISNNLTAQGTENKAIRDLIKALTDLEKSNNDKQQTAINAIPTAISTAKNEAIAEANKVNNALAAYKIANDLEVSNIRNAVNGKVDIAAVIAEVNRFEEVANGRYIPLSHYPSGDAFFTPGKNIPLRDKIVRYFGDGNYINLGRRLYMGDGGDFSELYWDGGALILVNRNFKCNNLMLTSDVRVKKDIFTIEKSLDKLDSLNGITYRMKNDNSQQGGLIAQDVEKVLPEAVSTGEDGMLTLNYNAVIGLLVNATKELKQENDELKGMMASLMTRVEHLVSGG